MMNSLYTAQTGLNVAKYSVDLTSNNIANENTESYKKRVVNTSELSLNDNSVGNGVSFDGVSRTTNQYLYNQIITQTSQESYYSSEDELLSQIEILFNETDSSGFSISLNDYFQSIESLRSNPSSEINKADFKNQATILTSTMSSLYSDLENLESNMQDQLNNEVDFVNEILEQIVYINEQLIINKDVQIDLLDKRDQLESQLSEFVDIEVTSTNDNYNLKISGVSAIFANTNLHEVSVVEEEGNTFLAIYNNDVNLSAGSLKSITDNLSEDTSAIYSSMQALDDFAKALIDESNANTTTPLYSGDSVANISFDSNAINSLSSNDLENLAQMQWGEDYNIDSSSTTTTSFSEFYQNFLTSVSISVENNAFKLDAQESVLQSLKTTYNNETKVDSDEEMVNLLEYQAAYEANAKVITVVDEMLQTLLNM